MTFTQKYFHPIWKVGIPSPQCSAEYCSYFCFFCTAFVLLCSVWLLWAFPPATSAQQIHLHFFLCYCAFAEPLLVHGHCPPQYGTPMILSALCFLLNFIPFNLFVFVSFIKIEVQIKGVFLRNM